MKTRTIIKTAAASVLIVSLILLGAGCSGGGGGGGGGGAAPAVLRIDASGVTPALWQGASVGPPLCGGPLAQNSVITITFGGPVDPGSLPPPGPITGTVSIATPGGTPLSGQLQVEDDSSLPAGNARRVTLRPALPATPAAVPTSGLLGPETFLLVIPAVGAGGAGPFLTVAGQPVTTPVATCFTVCDPGATGCYTDNVPGDPFIASTSPGTGDPSPPEIPACGIAGNRVSLAVSEPLHPAGIDAASVRLRVPASGAQVPGQVVFFQAGTPEAGPVGARIDYVASAPLIPGVTYELELGQGVRDFGGNPLRTYASGDPAAPASGRRLFRTASAPAVAQPPIVEDFSTAAQAASLGGVILWTGNGVLTVRAPDEFTGNGLLGAFTAGAGASTLDAGAAPVLVGGQTAFADGVWNFSQLTVSIGANVRLVGHGSGNRFRVHLKCTGAVNIAGVLNGTAGNLATAPLGAPEQGARAGSFNNGTSGNPTWVAGGVGGVGGGRGGNASQADEIGPALRTPKAEDGLGPPVAGVLNPGPFGANPWYAGGEGGEGAFLFPGGGVSGEVGGLGGAGGSSLASGLDGGPNSAAPVCAPLPLAVQSRALATGSPAVFATPVFQASAGSGGGGGGDKFDPAGVNNDDQGGGGGGGGGGVRISGSGPIALQAGSSITVNGGTGGQGNVFQGGHGGGGSGGQIWIQTLDQITIASAANLQVNGGGVNNACGNQAGGRGGAGLYQFEDADGVVNTSFSGPPAAGGNVVVIPFPFLSPVTGTATSGFYDTGSGNPDFAAVAATITLGTLAGAGVDLVFQGAHEALAGGGPDPLTLTAPVPAAQIDALDGRRFIRFTATLRYDLVLPHPPGAVLPSIDDVTVSFLAPPPCP